jgi:hypothetical protein
MRINELPQMHASSRSRIQLRISLVMLQKYKNSRSSQDGTC